MIDSKPTISIVVPAYNVDRYIDAALESVLSQTDSFHEVIVVDDGSTDATSLRLKEYANYPRVHIIRTCNRGLGAARNEGVKHATGEYIYFFDSDDILPPQFVTTIHAMLRETPDLDLIFFSGEIFFEEDFCNSDETMVSMHEFYRDLSGLYSSGLDAVAAMLQTGKFSPSACLYVSRRMLWEDDLAFKSIIHEDDELILRLCARARITCILDQVLYRRRIRNGSIMSTKITRRNAVGYFTALTSTWELSQQIASDVHRAILLKHFRFQVWQYLQTCKRAGIAPTIIESVYLARRFRYVPQADLLRALVPLWVRELVNRRRNHAYFRCCRQRKQVSLERQRWHSTM
jgi:glycosyltransferase involved in cell wall biosynthesis